MPIFRRTARPNPCFAESAYPERSLLSKTPLFDERVDPIQRVIWVAVRLFNWMIPARVAGFFCLRF